MNKNITIDVHHLTRIEGHGNIVLKIEDGKIQKLEWQVSEAPRFFEAMVVGRQFSEIAPITSRICGICSIGHFLASLKATEAAFNIKISEATRILREILIHGETLQSHILHVFYLVLPDLFKVNSIFQLFESHRDLILLVAGIHRLANDVCEVIGGRTTHPIRTKVGYFSQLPEKNEIDRLRDRLKKGLKDLQNLANIFQEASGRFIGFSRETEYLSLTNDKEYAFYDGEITTTDIYHTIPAEEYIKVVNEFVVPQSTAKYGKFNRDSFMVGALARYKNNHQQLSSICKTVAEGLGLEKSCNNPFMNNAAQVVECFHAIERSINHMEWLLNQKLQVERPVVSIKTGRGIGTLEVPRGTLFHDYTYDDDGICVSANCVIPTNLNHNNIQKDMEKMVTEQLNFPERDLRFNLEMLVRAYDPCVSCSTH